LFCIAEIKEAAEIYLKYNQHCDDFPAGFDAESEINKKKDEFLNLAKSVESVFQSEMKI
jgi:hypothetical protein